MIKGTMKAIKSKARETQEWQEGGRGISWQSSDIGSRICGSGYNQ